MARVRGGILNLIQQGKIAFIPILIGAAIGYAFDYWLEKYKESKCTCDETHTQLA